MDLLDIPSYSLRCSRVVNCHIRGPRCFHETTAKICEDDAMAQQCLFDLLARLGIGRFSGGAEPPDQWVTLAQPEVFFPISLRSAEPSP